MRIILVLKGLRWYWFRA